jgi:hypothetical protein
MRHTHMIREPNSAIRGIALRSQPCCIGLIVSHSDGLASSIGSDYGLLVHAAS